MSWSLGPSVRSSVPSADQPRTLVLYAYHGCPYCGRVFRALDQLGLTDQVELRDTLRDQQAEDQLFAATRRYTVPCLFIDGQPMFESLDIVEWLTRYAAGAEARRSLTADR